MNTSIKTPHYYPCIYTMLFVNSKKTHSLKDKKNSHFTFYLFSAVWWPCAKVLVTHHQLGVIGSDNNWCSSSTELASFIGRYRIGNSAHTVSSHSSTIHTNSLLDLSSTHVESMHCCQRQLRSTWFNLMQSYAQGSCQSYIIQLAQI